MFSKRLQIPDAGYGYFVTQSLSMPISTPIQLRCTHCPPTNNSIRCSGPLYRIGWSRSCDGLTDQHVTATVSWQPIRDRNVAVARSPLYPIHPIPSSSRQCPLLTPPLAPELILFVYYKCTFLLPPNRLLGPPIHRCLDHMASANGPLSLYQYACNVAVKFASGKQLPSLPAPPFPPSPPFSSQPPSS